MILKYSKVEEIQRELKGQEGDMVKEMQKELKGQRGAWLRMW